MFARMLEKWGIPPDVLARQDPKFFFKTVQRLGGSDRDDDTYVPDWMRGL